MSIKKVTLRVGGVPEHFNEPWLDAVAELRDALEWRSYPGGTGAMCESLAKGELDCALLLTEGAVKFCLDRPEVAQLHSVFVSSPLVWGVHCGSKSAWRSLDSIDATKEVTFAISRFGSGSHLMAFVLARERGWSKLKFEIVSNLAGAKEHLSKHENTLFMWEKAMTDPLVKQGVFSRLGECPTPWPCFVLAVNKSLSNTQYLEDVANLVRQKCINFKAVRAESIARVRTKFGIEEHLVVEWFDRLSFDLSAPLNIEMLKSVRATLIQVGQLPSTAPDASTIVMPRVTQARL